MNLLASVTAIQQNQYKLLWVWASLNQWHSHGTVHIRIVCGNMANQA